MNAPTTNDLRDGLIRGSLGSSHSPLHARACSLWFARPANTAPQMHAIASECIAIAGPARETQHAAALGYAASIDSSFAAAFQELLDWLMRRHYFVPRRPLTFENDGVGLLGVAVGILSLDAADRVAPTSWLANLLTKANPAGMPRDWGTDLMKAAADLAGVGGTPSAALPDDLRAALFERGVSAIQPDRDGAWRLIIAPLDHSDGFTRAATRVAALDWVMRTIASIGRDGHTAEDVTTLLDGVTHRSMRRWPWEDAPKTRNSSAAQWVVDNEYHVQSLLWAILSPVFPDLDDEEYLKSLGQKHPRADLVIPSLDLVVEVKFMRSTMQAAQVINEIASDASLYFPKGTTYRSMIAFVWDDAARTQEHDELKQGLLSLPRVVGAAIVSRPSHMVRGSTLRKTR